MTSALSRKTIALSGGETFAYFEAGDGPDLLLIHGALVTSHDMRVSLLEPLARRFHVIAMDRPGHGLSTRPRLSAAPAAQGKLIMEGARVLKLDQPIVVGHSLGATVALEIALSWPDQVSGVVAIAPIAFPEPRLETALFGPRATLGLGDWAAARIGGGGVDAALLPLLWRAMFLPQRMPRSFREGMAFEEVRSGTGLLANGEDAMATVPAVAKNALRYMGCHTPVELIDGDRDIVVNPWVHTRPLSRLLRNAASTIVRGRGHMLHHFEAELIVAKAVELSERTARLDDAARLRSA